MTNPIVDDLRSRDDVTTVTQENFDAFLDEPAGRICVLFFAGEKQNRLETADVAVVLREFVKAYPTELKAGVIAQEDEAKLLPKAKVAVIPSLSFFRDGEHLETIPKVQDWSVYQDKINGFLGATDQAAE